MAESAREILASGASELGIPLSEGQLDQFDSFTSLLLEWNRKFNLTRITDPAEIAVKHYLDSLCLLTVMNPGEGSSLIDIGTGAGLPGIPLKLARPDLVLTMLDSVRKKLSFIDAALADLGLSGVDLVHGRAEDIGHAKAYRGRYDIATSRAVARLTVLAELCIPFCSVGGRFAAYKGPDVQDELDEAQRAIGILGGKPAGAHGYTIPHSDVRHTLLVIEKVGPTPPMYPRKAGTPEKSPL